MLAEHTFVIILLFLTGGSKSQSLFLVQDTSPSPIPSPSQLNPSPVSSSFQVPEPTIIVILDSNSAPSPKNQVALEPDPEAINPIAQESISTPLVQEVSVTTPVPGSPLLPRFSSEGIVEPFEPVMGYPNEFQGIWAADPATQNYKNPEDSRIVLQEDVQCDIFFVTNLGISMYDYSPVAKCEDFSGLNPFFFLEQIEGADVAYGTDYTVYYALLDLQCTGDQEGYIIEVSSEGSYQCTVFKRIEDQLYLVFGYSYPYVEDVQCPSSWEADVSTDFYADSQIVYSAFQEGVYSPEFATCIG